MCPYSCFISISFICRGRNKLCHTRLLHKINQSLTRFKKGIFFFTTTLTMMFVCFEVDPITNRKLSHKEMSHIDTGMVQQKQHSINSMDKVLGHFLPLNFKNTVLSMHFFTFWSTSGPNFARGCLYKVNIVSNNVEKSISLKAAQNIVQKYKT